MVGRFLKVRCCSERGGEGVDEAAGEIVEAGFGVGVPRRMRR